MIESKNDASKNLEKALQQAKQRVANEKKKQNTVGREDNAKTMESRNTVLACVTLFIAATSLIKANGKTIIMKAFGYQSKDCANAVLGGYRPWAYFGFALGTVYQYLLLRIMVSVVFSNVAGVPEYSFDTQAMLVTLLLFIALYEAIMHVYAKRLEKLSIKEIMLE